MAKHKHWYMPVNIDTELADGLLNSCSLAAQGLYARLRLVMYKNTRRGFLERNGKAPTKDQIANMVGRSTEEVTPLLSELVDAGVLSTSKPENVLFSPRMVAEERERQKKSAAGKKGGSPLLKRVLKQPLKQTLTISYCSSKERGCGGKPPDLPDVLNNDAFLAAWADWVRHRSEIRKPLKPTTIRQQLKKLAAMGTLRAVAAIEHSIANGYQGLFEPKTPPGVPKPPEPPPIHIPDELIPPWDKDHAAGGPLCSTKDRWWQYGDDYKAGRMTGPDWWRDTPMGRKWLREQAQEAKVSQ